MFNPRPLQGVSPSLTLRPSAERSPSKFCENGRVYITDPTTGQPVCLCQLENHSAHSLQAHPALRGLRVFPTTRPTFGDIHNYQRQLSTMAHLTEPSNGLLPAQLPYHPYGAMYAGMDVNGGPIRKAATRETTGPLKIWLSEHKKNPYPTKAEKIMLAIITRMTLTQVSTWFANARRRLKKENKLYPADRDNRDDDDDDEDFGSGQREGNTSQSAGSEKRTTSESDTDDINVDLSDCSDEDDNVILASTATEIDQECLQKIHQGVAYDEIGPETESGQSSSVNSEQDQRKIGQSSQGTGHGSTAGSRGASPSIRPKIWSISEIINGSNTTKDGQGLKGQSIQTNSSLATSRHEFPPASILLIPETSLSVPFMHTCSSLPPSPFSPSSSALISPTAFRPFSSVIGAPSMPRHRPELTCFVSKHGLPVCGKSSPFDRHASAAAIKPHLMEANVSVSPAETTHSESVSIYYNQEEVAVKTKLNKYNDAISKKDKREIDAKNLQLSKATHPTPASILQPNNTLRSISMSPVSPTKPMFSNDASTSCKPQPERPRNLGEPDQHTIVNQSGQ